MSNPRLYREFANWFHLLTSPADYAIEARFYRELLTTSAEIPVTEVLELGSGGGNNASHMKEHFELTLVDLSEEMLEVSRSLNPECEHIQGDMRTIRLERQFDGVFIHDAIAYMTTVDDLRSAMATAFAHCKPGGAAVFAPDDVREAFHPKTDHGGHDGNGRSLRYLEVTWEPEPGGDTYTTDFAYLLRDETGRVWVEHDRHVCGLFTTATWLGLIEEAGFRAEPREGIEDETARIVFVGVKTFS